MNREDRIRRKAHELWEREGRPDGRAEAHWAQAEQSLDAEGAAEGTAAPPLEAGPAAAPGKRSGKAAKAVPDGSDPAPSMRN